MISTVALGIGAIHLVKPDVKIDGVTLVLAVIALVPWLGDLFESIELPGGAKLQYRKLEERLEAAEQRAEEVQLAVTDASRQARVALVASANESVREEGADEAVRRLLDEFTNLRRSTPSGPARTYRQELIFAELIKLAPQLADFDIAGALGSADDASRLTAYARLYACPEGDFLPTLVEAAAEEVIPFGQFWALRAVSAVIDAVGPDNVQLGTVRRLRSCLARIPQSAVDRAHLLRAILGRLEAAAD
ncbi:hypothetical protein E6W39_28230 [Kitasatospora acidiphila]|uniref:Uncharacterized protein n=1 Tax=Kitasatospora acidiphila TaxID=2567942 RepID=A0A540W8T6_9ACTN|nr:hypothetical protein [Kitasatospora acidiphila]TQF05412.1 hypothetical protein E6W39_28230 [Kitasatospora acidiphila]